MIIQLSRTKRAVQLALAATVLIATGARSETRGTMRTLAAGEHYRAGGVHRFLLGDDYRDLWTTPVEAPVLDLRTYAGGLKPVRRVGGQQTLGLALRGADGRSYTFRGIDKDPSEILPIEYQGTFIDRLMQDQIASSFPGGSVLVPPILEAAGVLHVEPKMVVMPNDSLLREFRSVFAEVLGTIEEYPRAGENGTPGTFGATEIIDGEEMWKRMDTSAADRPDARAFLTARLVDLLIGDWDRHRNQWRWARIPGKDMWQPIPEDRDQAFVRFEGLIPSVGRERLPQFVSFDDEYPGVDGLTWNGRDVDRRLLAGLEKPAWTEVTNEVRTRITDAVIADAASRMPAEYRRIEKGRLESALRARRDQLPEIAERFYEFLARKVDLRASNASEVTRVDRQENGDVNISVTSAESGTVFQRTFHPDETDEVRLYLGGGNDSLTTSGPRGDITVRVVGGEGDDTIDDRAGTKLRVSDESGENHVLRGAGTSLDTRPYVAPVREKAPWIPPRDWGRRNLFYPLIGGNSDLGVLFSVVLQSTGYGFRKDPYADKHTARVGYATRAGAFGGDYTGEFRFENSTMWAGLYARISGLDFLHFYGFGNETSSTEDDDFYKVKHTEYVFAPSLNWDVSDATTLHVRVGAKYHKTALESDRMITAVEPYGSDHLFQAGAGAGVSFDTRTAESALEGGVRLDLDGNVYPEVGGVEETFGEVHGEVAFYQPISFLKTPVLALRAGGKRVFGDYPYYDAAYIGGASTLRGFAKQRFAGDASAFGSAELRIPVTRIYLFVPARVGVFGLVDTGRVFFEDESSDKWHTGYGGGIWACLVDPASGMSLSIADSDEGTRIYVQVGLAF